MVVARPFPFLSFTGVERRELSVRDDKVSPAERRRDDERTLVAALSFVSGGVISCLAAETDRPVTVLLGALLVAVLLDASRDASRAFCARVEMTDLKGTEAADALSEGFRGTGAIGAESVSRTLPLNRARPRDSPSGSGVMRPFSTSGGDGREDCEVGRDVKSDAASTSASFSNSMEPPPAASGITAYTPRRVRRSLQLMVSVSDSSGESSA